MMKQIVVPGVDQIESAVCRIEVDDYVPLRFRAYEGLLGVRYVRLGNFSSSLLELLLNPNSMTIVGFTLTSFDAVHPLKGVGALPQSTGLPMVSLANEFNGPIDAQRIDIKKEFTVGFGDELIEIDLGGISDAQQIVVCGSVEFYVKSGFLVGIRISGLTSEQLLMIQALHQQHDPKH